MKNKHLTANQLVDIYELKQQGKNPKRIAKELGIKEVTTYYACKRLETLIAEEIKPEDTTPNYQKAFSIIKKKKQEPVATDRKEEPATTDWLTPKVQEHTEQTPLDKLEQAFIQFQTVLVEVIDQEAKRRSMELVKEKEDQLAKQEDKYEKELQRLQEVLVAMQNSSAIGMIKKMWNQT